MPQALAQCSDCLALNSLCTPYVPFTCEHICQISRHLQRVAVEALLFAPLAWHCYCSVCRGVPFYTASYPHPKKAPSKPAQLHLVCASSAVGASKANTARALKVCVPAIYCYCTRYLGMSCYVSKTSYGFFYIASNAWKDDAHAFLDSNMPASQHSVMG